MKKKSSPKAAPALKKPVTRRVATSTHFDPIEEVIEEIRRGKMVIVTDDEDRENEGDLVMAAQDATCSAPGNNSGTKACPASDCHRTQPNRGGSPRCSRPTARRA